MGQHQKTASISRLSVICQSVLSYTVITRVNTMTFEWDEAKNEANRRKHGLDFADAAAVFSGSTLTFADHRHSSDEPRYLTLGCWRVGWSSSPTHNAVMRHE